MSGASAGLILESKSLTELPSPGPSVHPRDHLTSPVAPSPQRRELPEPSPRGVRRLLKCLLFHSGPSGSVLLDSVLSLACLEEQI